jgi:predicted RNA binding protein with dsRBD fold (UPF0201 family)
VLPNNRFSEKILDNTRNRITLQCVFHSIRFKVNKKIGCLGEIAFFYENHPRIAAILELYTSIRIPQEEAKEQ